MTVTDGYMPRFAALRALLPAALIWLVASLSGCGGTTHLAAIALVRPAGANPAAVRIRLAAGATYKDSAVARWGASNTWFAVVAAAPRTEGRDIQVYKLEGNRWRLNATVEARSFPAPIESVEVASLTHSGAPDFTIHVSGADTPWLAVISRTGGRWHQVPFNRPPEVSLSVSGIVEDNLIHILLDRGGGAEGPTTRIWYRYAGGAFVPTRSPDEPEPCTKAALEHSHRLLGRPQEGERSYLPWSAADLTRHLVVQRFACLDGWAATTSTGQAGRADLAFYEDQRGEWLTAAEGTPARVATGSQIFAAPPTLLDRLAAAVGTPIAVPHEPFGHSYEPGSRSEVLRLARLPAFEKAAISAPDPPGSRMAATISRQKDGTTWLATVIEEPPSTASSHSRVTAAVYRWDGETWKQQAEIAYLAVSSGGTRLWDLQGAYITGRSTPDFAITRSYETASEHSDRSEPGFVFWTAVIAKINQRWEVVPFLRRHRPRAEVQAIVSPVHLAEREEAGFWNIIAQQIEPQQASGLYRYRNGAFELKP